MVRKIVLSLIAVLVFIAGAFAQAKQVRGSVVDENGEAIIGASVIVKGTTIGVSTDQQGFFVLNNVPANAQTLQISYLGYVTKEVPVRSTVEVQMEPDLQTLETVVVTGMTKTDKRLFTGAADRLVGEDVRMSGMADISRGLEGRSAGVSVQNVSGTFGTAPKIRVRGATSIYGSSKPLWVVDGIIIEDVVEIDADALSSGDATTLISSAISGLNAEDIESFSILKDGSATSIYGARAMSGVIVVTTKKGQAGVSRINYTGEFTIRQIPSYSNFNIMNSQEQMDVYRELSDKGWLNNARISNASSSGIYGKMWQLVNSGNLLNTPEAMNAYLRQAEYRNTDWFQQLFRNSMMHNHSVSMSSGTEKSQYYASMSAMFDPGWSLSSDVKRYTFNLNASYKVYENVTLNLIGGASYRQQKAPGTLGSEVDPVSGEVKRDFDINPYSYALNTSRALDPNEYYTRSYAPFNILRELEQNYIDLDVVDTKFQANLIYKPVIGLELSALAAVKYSATTQEHNITEFSNQAQAYRAMGTTTIRDANPLLYTDPDDPFSVPVTVLPQGGIYKRRDNKMLSYDFRFSAAYNTEINNQHIINLFGGMEINQSDRHATSFNGWGMQYAQGEIPFYAYEVFKKGKEENSQYYTLDNTHYRNVAFFFNGTYSWKGRYTINGTFRYEGTNRMGKSTKSRWLPTWNVAGAWNVHEENFFKALTPAMSHLTFKASYSLTADRGPANVTNSRAVIKSRNPWRPNAGTTESGLGLDRLENSELTYEKKHELNIGLDMGFINNRINVAVDWYKRNNFDLIGDVVTQGIGGEIEKKGNVAEMKSSGWEVTLSTRNIQTKNFTWTTDFTYSHTKNEVTKLETITRAIELVSGTGFTQVGYPVRSLFSYDFRGLNEAGLPMVVNEKGQIATTDINFQERKNFGNLIYSGPSEATDVGGFGNIFQFKGFKLNVFMTYSFGNVVRLDPVFKEQYSDLDAMPREFRNRWFVSGDEMRTDVPSIANVRQSDDDINLPRAYNAYNYSTARIASGDFIRLKEVSLTYDFPKRWISKLRFSTLSLKVQATNLCLLYADKKLNGQDPEFFNTGGVAAPLPQQFTFTLRIGF